jgi:hypothetical protein
VALRRDLEALIASEARSALRIADVLAGKSPDYWSRSGRGRTERELADDGLPPERIDAVILAVEGKPPAETDLDRILADLIARERRH